MGHMEDKSIERPEIIFYFFKYFFYLNILNLNLLKYNLKKVKKRILNTKIF